MKYDRLTVKAQEALQEADSIQETYNHGAMEVEHYLLALLRQQDGVIPPLLDRLGADRSVLAQEIETALGQKPRVYGDTAQKTISPELARNLN